MKLNKKFEINYSQRLYFSDNLLTFSHGDVVFTSVNDVLISLLILDVVLEQQKSMFF